MSNALFNVGKAVAGLDDQTETSTGFVRTPPAAGLAMGRFVQYIEIGSHIRKFDGKDKPAAKQVRFGFELHGRHVEEREVDGVKKKFYPVISDEIALSLNSKAGFKKLFNAMVAGREGITHMSQMLGEPFLMEIIHTAGKKDPKKIYAGIKKDGAYTIRSPYMPVTDAMGMPTGETKLVPVPEATDENVRVFLWDAPDPAQWDSLFIDGTYTRKIDGVEKEFSKNFLQEEVLTAKNFLGSPIEAMLSAGGNIDDLISGIQKPEEDDDMPDMIDDGDGGAEQEEEKAPETPEADLPEVPAEEPVSEKTEEEILAEMGLA